MEILMSNHKTKFAKMLEILNLIKMIWLKVGNNKIKKKLNYMNNKIYNDTFFYYFIHTFVFFCFYCFFL